MSSLSRRCKTCGAEGGTCACYLRDMPAFDLTGVRCECGNYLVLGQMLCEACRLAAFAERVEAVVTERAQGLRQRIAQRWPGYDADGRTP